MDGRPALATSLSAAEYAVLLGEVTKRYGGAFSVEDAIDGSLLHAAGLATVAGLTPERLAKLAKRAMQKHQIAHAALQNARKTLVDPSGARATAP